MLKPMAPQVGVEGDEERYRKDMVAFYANPEAWGWAGSHGPRPAPERTPDGRDTYHSHGVLKYLETGDIVKTRRSTAKVAETPRVGATGPPDS